MGINLNDLTEARNYALSIHSRWKQEIALADLVANDKWDIMWPDRTVEESDPLVENLYAQALEDKSMTAAAGLPRLFTTPARGTRSDEGERNAELRKRAALATWERSNLKSRTQRAYMDLFHTGLIAGIPWVDWNVPPAQRHPFFLLLNPRQVFPLGYDATGRLTAGLVMRQKRLKELEKDWGENHPAIASARRRHETQTGQAGKLEWMEEIWWFDKTTWAVALVDTQLPAEWQGSPIVPNAARLSSGVAGEWLHAPEPHRLQGTPLIVEARTTIDDSPRGALMDIVPQLKVAQNFMARLLDDLDSSIYAPVVLDNIENSHEYGPAAVLIGNGNGTASVNRDRPPVNFEAQQTVAEIIERARRQAFEPPQRTGEAGASIVSAKGTMALMGTFNAELAAAQQSFESWLENLTSITANFDEVWCPGRKEIWGVDQSNQEFSEKYDPTTTYKGDYRFKVTYGDRTGLDEQNHLIRLSTVKNMGGMSTRTFMMKAGISDDVLQEERDIAIEQLTNLFFQGLLPQTIMQGDLNALHAFVDLLDDDSKTIRQAVLETIKSQSSVPPGEQGTDQNRQRADILRMAKSLEQGGIPGNAEGQPATQLAGSPGFAPAVRRGLQQIAPGGN